MCSDLRKLGVVPNKLFLISKVPQIPDYLIRHFIRGYFDGDGSIFSSHNTSYFKRNGIVKKYQYKIYAFSMLGTTEFLKDVIDFLPANHYSIRDTKTNEIKELRISAKCEFNLLFDYLYNDSTICLERKYNKWLEIKSAFTK
ncbi:hypothetical protein CPJCM30710_08740 [Clostridium polyendosporum]|uniref:LAGLIDADG endonuclease n=1 Tax=Clostridium polyendosporum TaxID=69208 RepID=A0A919S077_9CLOT|nr:hypothetical protein [Clostridium polyendosporum]GIM28208.1 hypothetical protein CPJCM30710_08740 [Clostridium polyendosporum]